MANRWKQPPHPASQNIPAERPDSDAFARIAWPVRIVAVVLAVPVLAAWRSVVRPGCRVIWRALRWLSRQHPIRVPGLVWHGTTWSLARFGHLTRHFVVRPVWRYVLMPADRHLLRPVWRLAGQSPALAVATLGRAWGLLWRVVFRPVMRWPLARWSQRVARYPVIRSLSGGPR
ncbi:MAG: hypothetical protein HKP61_08735 [Dactylosporangium sp.]|nr:hypothetical protein [Dactylosporangium sp.]NNJ61020.1 hypothetical protein [Dactylosporangium sp.]